MRRLFVRSLRLLVVTLLLLELVLQVLSFGTWWFAGSGVGGRAAELPAGSRVLLCLGDSFTWGMGASDRDHSYPAVLAERLGADWVAVNGGWPGRNSRGLLEGLDRMLADYAPELVCVVVGVNDTWNRPAELRLDAGAQTAASDVDTGFRWEWRTLRLLKAFRVHKPFFGEGDGTAAEDDFVTDWLLPSVGASGAPLALSGDAAWLPGVWDLGVSGRLTLMPDGLGLWAGVPIRWRPENGDRLQIMRPGSFIMLGDYRVDGDRLSLRLESAERWVRGLRIGEPGPADRAELRAAVERGLAGASLAAAITLREAGRPERALEVLAPRWSESVESPGPMLRELVLAAHAAGDAAAEARWLAEFEQVDDPVRHAETLWELGQGPAAQALLEPHASPGARLLRARMDLRDGAREEGAAALRGLLTEQEDFPERSAALRVLHDALLPEEPEAALDATLEAFARDGNEPALRRQFDLGWAQYEEAFAAHAEAIPMEPARRTRLQELAAERRAGGMPEQDRIFRSHLRQLVARCRAAGAEPVFGTYPYRGGWYQAAAEELAAELEVLRVDVAAAFDDALRADPGLDLFVPDRHCNDAGYALMAEAFARVLRDRGY